MLVGACITMRPDRFAAAVAALHRVAEEVVAPARKPDNEIALEATPGGFGTPVFEWEGSFQQVRVEGAALVYERREPLDVDPDAAAALAEWYALGDDVLRALGANRMDVLIKVGLPRSMPLALSLAV